MHGAVLHSLSSFITSTHGSLAWERVGKTAGFRDAYFLPTREYPDALAAAVFDAAAGATGQPLGELLESFGEFLAPALLNMYGAFLDPGWRTLDVVEHTETTIHRVVRMRDPAARPPILHAERRSHDEVVVVYQSPRRMCHLGVGIIRGVAAHFRERVLVHQDACMHRGADRCEIVARNAVVTDTAPAARPEGENAA